MKRRVEIRSASGALVDEIDVVPLAICGQRRYRAGGALEEASGCAVDEPRHVEAFGGRRRDVLDVPAGYEVYQLTAPNRRALEADLRELGEAPEAWIAAASVHGAWKIQRHQGVVVRVRP